MKIDISTSLVELSSGAFGGELFEKTEALAKSLNEMPALATVVALIFNGPQANQAKKAASDLSILIVDRMQMAADPSYFPDTTISDLQTGEHGRELEVAAFALMDAIADMPLDRALTILQHESNSYFSGAVRAAAKNLADAVEEYKKDMEGFPYDDDNFFANDTLDGVFWT